VTFDLWRELLSYFQAIYFESLDLATSFFVWRHIFRISRLQFSFKVVGLRSRSQQQKVVAYNSKTTGRKCWGLIGVSVTITLEVIGSFWHFDLDLWLWDIFSFFSIQTLKFWTSYASSFIFSVRYIFRMSRSSSSFKIMRVNLEVTVEKQRQRAGLCSSRIQFNCICIG